MSALREQRREETRRRLYEAALEVFRRDGVAACRIDDIARAAGVSRASFYFHYPTKDDVLIEYMRDTEVQMTAAVEALPADTSLWQVLDTVSNVLAAIWQDDPRLLPDVAAVGMRYTATHLTDSQSDTLRHIMAERFHSAAERGELSTLLPSEILSGMYLGHMLAGLLAWYGHPDTPLSVVLKSSNILFVGGVQVGTDCAAAPPKRRPARP